MIPSFYAGILAQMEGLTEGMESCIREFENGEKMREYHEQIKVGAQKSLINSPIVIEDARLAFCRSLVAS